MTEVVVEFLITKGLEIAQACVFKIMRHSTKQTGLFPESAFQAWKPQLDQIDDHIKNLSTRTYKAALSHIKEALLIMHNFEDKRGVVDLDKEGVTIKSLSGMPVALPKESKKLARMAYESATECYNDTNLGLEQRCQAAKVILLAVGIIHYEEPQVVLFRWQERVKEIMNNPEIQHAIHAKASRNPLLKMGGAGKDFTKVMQFVNDVSKALCFFPCAQLRRTLAQLSIPHHNDGNHQDDEQANKVWTKKYLTLNSHNHDIPLAARAFDLAATPDRMLLISTKLQKLFKLQVGPKIETEEIDGHFSALGYDVQRQQVWALKSSREFALYDMHSKLLANLQGPTPPAKGFYRWRIDSTQSGLVLVAAEMETGEERHLSQPQVFLSRDAGASWQPINFPAGHVTNASVTSVAVLDQPRQAGCVRVALATPRGLWVGVIGAQNELLTTTTPLTSVAPSLFDQQALQCDVDEFGRLVVAARGRGIFLLDDAWQQVLDDIQDKDLQTPQGLAAREGQIYVLLPNSLRIYDYVP